jgi:hypothetical protein
MQSRSKVENPLATIAMLARDNKMTTGQGKVWHKGYLDSLARGKR